MNASNTIILLLSAVAFGVSLRIQDRAHQALEKALKEREAALKERKEAELFYEQAQVRNYQAIEAQTEAGRMLEATRALVKEHRL